MKINAYIKLMKILLFGEEYMSLSIYAVVCYCVLLDRNSLSELTERRDKNGEVYVIYSQESLGRALRCKRKKVAKVLLELEEYGLIRRKHQGINKADAIYVHALPMSPSGTSSCTSGEHYDVSVEDNINTDIIKTEFNDIDQMRYDINDVCIELQAQWDYRYICTLGDEIAYIAGRIIDVATSIICKTADKIYIAGDMRDTTHVQTCILRLTSAHIVGISRRIIDNQNNINDMYGYIAAALYNSGIQVPHG